MFVLHTATASSGVPALGTVSIGGLSIAFWNAMWCFFASEDDFESARTMISRHWEATIEPVLITAVSQLISLRISRLDASIAALPEAFVGFQALLGGMLLSVLRQERSRLAAVVDALRGGERFTDASENQVSE